MQKSITFKNAKISFSDYGKGSAIVLIHGFLENSTMWDKIVPELSKRNRIITIDLLGHGKTDCLGYVNSMELLAETIEAVLKSLRIRKCILIGHSLGGYVGLAFAEKHPQKIKGLCLMNSTSSADDDKRKMLRLRANKMIQNHFTNMIRMSFTNLFGSISKIKYKREIDFALNEALKTSVQGYISAQEGMRVRPDRSNVLANDNFKKLFIIGEKDPVLDYKSLIEEAKITASEAVIFPNGHMSHIENTRALISCFHSFIKKCSSKK